MMHFILLQLGEAVGYAMRFEEFVSFQTVLKYCTDGLLLNEATRKEKLEKYGIIVLDEVHERSMITDVLMGLIKVIREHFESISSSILYIFYCNIQIIRNLQQVAATRPELRVVVMSATMETGNFRNYFDQRSVELKLPGRTHPVEIVHSSRRSTISDPISVDRTLEMEPYCVMAIDMVREVHERELTTPGDILLFLTGEEVKMPFDAF
jgi:pre-mRNA-splicing factor ATP-dependent RNA helicase DHX15/PRP43